MRTPDLRALETEVPKTPTLSEAAARWRKSRVAVAESTRVLHRVVLERALTVPEDRRVDEITPADVTELVATLAGSGSKRETTARASSTSLPCSTSAGSRATTRRAKSIRLPHEEEELSPPTSEHVEAVYRALAPAYRLPLLWLEGRGPRRFCRHAHCRDYDERARPLRLRASTTRTRAALCVELHPTLAEALEASLRPREDRDLDAPLPGAIADRLRTAIARACKAGGVPLFSPPRRAAP